MIILIAEDSYDEMSVSLHSNLTEKGVENIFVLQSTLPQKNNITVFSKGGKLLGEFIIDGQIIDIETITAIYTRMGTVDTENVSERTNQEINMERMLCFDSILENIDAMVINRTKSQFPNSSKLFQSYIIKNYGFKIPDSVISNDVSFVKDFIKDHEKHGVIYKSASSERSKVQKFKKEDYDNLEYLQHCPHLFQECVNGKDIRVHALATGEVFACEISTETSDYRYDKERNINIVELPKQVKEACVKMTLDMGLYLSGIDLRHTPDDEFYCFEVNPSPAFTWYEAQTGLPITDAVANMMIQSYKYKNLAVRKF